MRAFSQYEWNLAVLEQLKKDGKTKYIGLLQWVTENVKDNQQVLYSPKQIAMDNAGIGHQVWEFYVFLFRNGFIKLKFVKHTADDHCVLFSLINPKSQKETK